jgi:hypothetical protein
MNERLKDLYKSCRPKEALASQEQYNSANVLLGSEVEKFAELIIKDLFNELYVVYPGGKRGSDVAFQNISLRDWVKQVYGVDA